MERILSHLQNIYPDTKQGVWSLTEAWLQEMFNIENQAK